MLALIAAVGIALVGGFVYLRMAGGKPPAIFGHFTRVHDDNTQTTHEHSRAAKRKRRTQAEAAEHATDEVYLTGSDCPAPQGCRFNVTCASDHYTPFIPGCHPRPDVPGSCARIAMSEFASKDEVALLIDMAERGMAGRSKAGGPTILDINGGFLRDPQGVVNIYKGRESLYSVDEYRFYGDIVERIRAFVQASFELDFLYFTAPTFITRLVGNSQWKPKSMHDEYWHMHVDKESTDHYDYSGLLYLSEQGVDFEGGLFRMESPPMVVKPTPGLVLSFSAGRENKHQVALVTEGTRYCLSFWFTCNASRRFKTFLDGKAHDRFEGAPAEVTDARN
ncbi:hypothetical protein JKP88DRAFT_200696 [Tribonema minus]|uniref:Fe2OG dioxygenase domain-containing protein n=1 Tax=Tribonema minus TaxID=303371 RepID=A0A836CCH1_9STRA|nr:hypothetical protein JKP88DRAFT_200696 [Tribonema minus]